MSRGEWGKTPYAGTEARRTEEGVERLLARYGIDEYWWAQGRGPNGRPAILLRFPLRDRTYKFVVEVLDADVEAEKLVSQAKRALYYYLKSSLEISSLFFSAEKALFSFLEIGDGRTIYEVAEPNMRQLGRADWGQLFLTAGR